MTPATTRPAPWRRFLSDHAVLFFFAFLKLAIHLAANAATAYGFHRDEFLYLALGEHLKFGYMEVPPSIAVFARLSTLLFGGSLFAVRIVPALLGAATVFLAGRIAKELGGGRFGQSLACLMVIVSPSFLHVNTLFQPVAFDLFYWTLYAFLTIRAVRTGDPKWLIGLGVAFGLGMLNKYTVLLFAFGLIAGLLLTRQRILLKTRMLPIAAAVAFVLFLPNLVWQIRHQLPLVRHMSELSRTQLVNVRPASFLLDQAIMMGIGLVVWLPGLLFLFFHPRVRPFRFLGWAYLIVVAALLTLSGKGYYALGLYPMLLASGAVFYEFLWRRPWQKWLRAGFVVLMVGLTLPVLPLGLPIMAPEPMKKYCSDLADRYGLDAPMRWEDGKRHSLPQDWADMLGWEEMAEAAGKTFAGLSDREKRRCLVFAEDYGQAGAVDWLGKPYGLPPVISLSSSYRLWAPDSAAFDLLIYVGGDPDDIAAYFNSVERTGGVTNPDSRETGTGVFLLRGPKPSLADVWRKALGGG
jgi:hypothetical protein